MSKYNKNHPQSFKESDWEKYLNRELTDKEKDILDDAYVERSYNIALRELTENINKHNLYVPQLTNYDGNCVFESLAYLGLCDDFDNLRKFTAHMMYYFKNTKHFFGNLDDDRTLEEIFNQFNVVENVLCTTNGYLYKYTYETMCQDLSNEYSWSRIETHFILSVISTLFEVRFEIHNNSNTFVSIIGDTYSRVIHLGYIDNNHYVPLSVKSYDVHNLECQKYPKYCDAYIAYYKWSKTVEKSKKKSHNSIDNEA